LPMRMANRIYADPDSDPEQDIYGMISRGVDHPGLLLLLYPRPVMVASAILDFFPIEGARKSFREVQVLYEKFGHGDRIAMVEGYHKHEYSAENQAAAFAFLDRFNRMPAKTGSAEPAALADRDLLCTKSGQVMLEEEGARPLLDVIREYYEQRKATPHRTLPEEYRSGSDRSIPTWGVEMFDGAPPHDRQIAWESRGTERVGGFLVEKYLLRYSKGLEMPLIFIHADSDEKRAVLLWFGENGKAGPSDWSALQGLMRSGFDIVTFDVRGLGETRMRFTAVSPDDPALGKLEFDQAYGNSLSGVLANHVYNSLLTGRPYLFDMIEDAEIASRFAQAKLQRNVTAVSSTGRGYTLAGVVSQVLSGVKLTNPGNEKILRWSEIVEGEREVWPIELLVPGGAYLQ
jgi:hypothetical protein